MELFTLLENLLLFLMLMVPGYMMGRCKLLSEKAQADIGSILMYIAMPFLVFEKLLETDLRALDPVAPIIAVAVPLALSGCLLLAGRLLWPASGDPRRWRVSRFCSFLHNCGFWGLPLAAALFPDTPEVTLYVSIANIVNTFLLLTVGTYVLSGDAGRISLKGLLLSPALIALAAGCVCSLLGANAHFPQLGEFAAKLAGLAAPLSMLSLGLITAKMPLKKIFSSPVLYAVCGVKLVLSPALTMGALLALRALGAAVPITLMDALFLVTAVSSAASSPALAAKYGLDEEHAAVLTVGTTLLCVVTMPVLYEVFSAFY